MTPTPTLREILEKIDFLINSQLDQITKKGSLNSLITDVGPGETTRTTQISHTLGLADLRALRKDLEASIKVARDTEPSTRECSITDLYEDPDNA